MRLRHNSRLAKILFPPLTGMALLISGYASASDYGTTGLIDTPTARMQSDGVFSATTAFDGRHRQFAITYQATPWLEGTFRYTGFNDFFYWDRNYGSKRAHGTRENILRVEAVGTAPVGTGVFSSEYLWRLAVWCYRCKLRLGWGRLAARAIFRTRSPISDRFDVEIQNVLRRVFIDNFSAPKQILRRESWA